MIKVGLLGGRGYVGEELLRLMQYHSQFQPVFVGSSSMAGQAVQTEYDDLDCLKLNFSPLDQSAVANCSADAWIIAQPNGAAHELVSWFDNRDRLIDVSSDHRFDESWVYGLPERNANAIQSTNRLANPGCYATAAQLALLPLLDQIDETTRIFGVSGYSGAGRKPNDKNDPVRIRDNILPYSLADHGHQREVSIQLDKPVSLMPHVGPFFRGISLTISARLRQPTNPQWLHHHFAQYYERDPLIEVQNDVPEIRHVAGTNACHIGGFSVDPRDAHQVVFVSVLDNLRKGAAAQVIQNLNLMFGFDSSEGLI